MQRLRSAIYRAAVGQDHGRLAVRARAADRGALWHSDACAGCADGPCSGGRPEGEGRATSPRCTGRSAAIPRRSRRRRGPGASACATAGVVTVLKHWPGHGSARNTHTGPASVPPLSTLEAPGHAAVQHRAVPRRPGRDGRPPHVEGPDRAGRPGQRVVATRCTTCGTRPAPTSSSSPTPSTWRRPPASLGLKPAGAALRALRAGADWALVCGNHPRSAIASIRDAIDVGSSAPRQGGGLGTTHRGPQVELRPRPALASPTARVDRARRHREQEPTRRSAGRPARTSSTSHDW